MLKAARSGDMRSRMRAIRDGQAAVRLAAVGAGLRTGALDRLLRAPSTTAQLAHDAGWSDDDLAEGLLRVLSAMGLARSAGGRWELTRQARTLLEDDVARAMYEGFSDYHTGLYAGVEQQLRGGPGRLDVAEKGDVIARLSQAMDPFVLDVLDQEVSRLRPRRILDVGCATGSHLTHMLRAAPAAAGVGVEVDPSAAEMARRRVAREGLTERAQIIEGDARNAVDPATAEAFDLVLLANIIYYLPMKERVPLLRSVAELTRVGGVVVVVTTALTDALFSRHFDLLLRAQEGAMALPAVEELNDQLRQAGLTPSKPRRIAPGEPLTAVVASRA